MGFDVKVSDMMDCSLQSLYKGPNALEGLTMILLDRSGG